MENTKRNLYFHEFFSTYSFALDKDLFFNGQMIYNIIGRAG